MSGSVGTTVWISCRSKVELCQLWSLIQNILANHSYFVADYRSTCCFFIAVITISGRQVFTFDTQLPHELRTRTHHLPPDSILLASSTDQRLWLGQFFLTSYWLVRQTELAML